MNRIILGIMAAGVVLGGVDRMFGSPKGYGKKFEEGFFFLGPTALSMAGMICLTPVLAQTLGKGIIPVFGLLGVDPAVFGGMLAIDMGGYQLACSLARDPLMGQYAGIVISAVFGCTVVFTVPVGMELVTAEDKPLFAEGIMIGLMVMPVSLLTGGLACGLPVLRILHQNLPILLFSLLLLIGLKKAPAIMIKGFTLFCLRDPDPHYCRAGACRGGFPDRVHSPSRHDASGGCAVCGGIHRHCHAGQPPDGGASDPHPAQAPFVAGKKMRHEQHEHSRLPDRNCQRHTGNHYAEAYGQKREGGQCGIPCQRRFHACGTPGIYGERSARYASRPVSCQAVGRICIDSGGPVFYGEEKRDGKQDGSVIRYR